MVKITGGQRIDLLGIRKEDLPGVWRDLGMPSGHAYTKAFRTCKTCVGTDFCRYGVGDSTTLGIAIEKRFQGIESPAQDEAGRDRLPAQLLGGDHQGPRRRRDRGRALGGLRRRRRRLARAQGRPAVHGRHARRGAALHGPLHAVLPRARASTWSAPTTSSSAWGSTSCAACWSTTRRAWPRGSTPTIQAAVDAYVDPWQEAEAPVHPAQFRTDRRRRAHGGVTRCR